MLVPRYNSGVFKSEIGVECWSYRAPAAKRPSRRCLRQHAQNAWQIPHFGPQDYNFRSMERNSESDLRSIDMIHPYFRRYA